VFSIRCDPFLLVFPQRGYRIKPTSNQENQCASCTHLKVVTFSSRIFSTFFAIFRPSLNLVINVSFSLTIKKRNDKMGRGDLVLKHVNLGGWLLTSQSTTNSAAITWLTLAETGRFGTRSQAGSWSTDRTKVDLYRAGYAAMNAFLPCVISTSGRLHGEFLRLLYIIAHRRTSNWFKRHSNDEPSEEQVPPWAILLAHARRYRPLKLPLQAELLASKRALRLMLAPQGPLGLSASLLCLSCQCT